MNANEAPIWQDPARDPRERAEALVSAMTLEQKIGQLHGAMETIDIYRATREAAEAGEDLSSLAEQIRVERHVQAEPELGIPRMRVTNGPVGVGMGDGTPSPAATALPMTIGLAAGFDPSLARDYGDLIGEETATLGQHVLEGPGLCLHRTAIGGRNFEYFSEDPYLTGVMGVEVTRAIQAHDVIAMAKHFVVNDQETERFRANVEVDDEVLRELYLLPFEMVVKDADIAAVMSAYNRIGGTYATENHLTLTRILREEWGFAGYVQSDFWSCRSAAPALSAGMDLEMPDAKWLNAETITSALEDLSLELATVDRALVRRFTQMFRFGQFDRPYAPGEIDAEGHGATSRRIGTEVAVLLKNDPPRGGDAPLLPLAAAGSDRFSGEILVVGQARYARDACQGGGGSSRVTPLYTVAPVDGLRDVLGELGSTATVSSVIVEDDLANLTGAVTAAKDADTVVVMAGIVATEGDDRPDLSLPDQQDRMIAQLLAANPRTIVVLKDSSPVLMPWIDDAAAVLETWNQGSEDGHAVADLLLGRANPSGKLPITYPRREEDTLYAGQPSRHPGTDEGAGYPVIRYSEGRAMGYRWHQSQGIEPLFGFGFGLSYTTFEVRDVHVEAPAPRSEPITVRAVVENTGDVPGAEVVQVYVGLPGPGQPPKRLVGFSKVTVAPGNRETVEIVIDPEATHHPLSVWDRGAHAFVIPPGTATVHVGTCADDTPVTERIDLG